MLYHASQAGALVLKSAVFESWEGFRRAGRSHCLIAGLAMTDHYMLRSFHHNHYNSHNTVGLSVDLVTAVCTLLVSEFSFEGTDF